MQFISEHALAPMIGKFCRRTPLGVDEISLLENLPHHIGKLERGEFVAREGDQPSFCVVVLSGYLYRSNVTGDGKRQVFAIHLQGDLVCARDFYLEEADHNIQALSNAKLAYIRRDVVLAAADRNPIFARAFWRDNSINGAVYREWLINIGRRNARQRIAHLICELATRSEAAGLCNAMEYIWPLTQEELGDATGLTAVHVNRTVGRLRNENLINISSGGLQIKDWVGLRVAGDFRAGYLHEYEAA